MFGTAWRENDKFSLCIVDIYSFGDIINSYTANDGHTNQFIAFVAIFKKPKCFIIFFMWSTLIFSTLKMGFCPDLNEYEYS